MRSPEWLGVHDDPGVQDALRIKDALGLFETRHQVGGVHAGQQFAAQASITMLT